MDKRREPLFSVIVPVYKVEQYLHQCVDSILAQTFSDFEVILVDDGSPDRCGAICDEYARKDARVKVIHKENGGLVSARRAGYAISTGRYICNVDSDDYIAPELLKMVEAKICNHCVDAVLFGLTRFGEGEDECIHQGVPEGLYDEERMEQIRKNLILGANSATAILNNLCALAMRKDRFDPYFTAFPETIYRGEDLAVTAPALAHCSAVYVLEECPYFYRRTAGSIMNSHRGDELEQALLLADYLQGKMGMSFDAKLNAYVLKECFDLLTHYRENWSEYRWKVKKIQDDRLLRHLRGARCGKKASLPDRIVFFLLRHQLFDVLWLIWRIRSKR